MQIRNWLAYSAGWKVEQDGPAGLISIIVYIFSVVELGWYNKKK